MNKVFFEPSLLPMSIAAPPPALLGRSDQLTLREPPTPPSGKKGGRGAGATPHASRGGGGISRSWPGGALLFAAAQGASCSIAWLRMLAALLAPSTQKGAGVAEGASRGL